MFLAEAPGQAIHEAKLIIVSQKVSLSKDSHCSRCCAYTDATMQCSDLSLFVSYPLSLNVGIKKLLAMIEASQLVYYMHCPL